MSSYYNENDKFAAEWLRKLIAKNLIAPGEVDERYIQNVQPEDLRGFTQCHFFAGIGVWSYALRAAGWPDDKPVWTGSCPCQPFSVSGKRAKASDGRHLWPYWFPLIRESRPIVVFGEQVASDDGLAWLDLVHSDLEGQGYTVGAVDTCAAGFGAPHIRQRLYLVADTGHREHSGRSGFRYAGGVDAREAQACQGTEADGQRPIHDATDGSSVSKLGDPNGAGLQGHGRYVPEYGPEGRQDAGRFDREAGFWSNAEWIWCKDQKYRPTKPSLFPLATGIANRVGMLRGAGNALNAEQARGFIEAYMQVTEFPTMPVAYEVTR